MKFDYPEATPSNNAVMRMHHRERTKQHERAAWLVRDIVGSQCIPVRSCTVSVTRYGARLLDWDNMGGGLKFLFDAMVKNGLIIDDNPRCVTRLNLYQEKCEKVAERTTVIIESI